MRPTLLLLICGFLSTLYAQQTITPAWVRQPGTASNEAGIEVATAPDGVYVGGQTLGTFPTFQNAGGGDAILFKYNAQGTLLWTRQYGTTPNDSILGLAADATGVYVVGGTGAALPGQPYAGSFDSYVRKYDPNGNILWTNQFGSTGSDELNQAVLDSTGLYVVGRVVGALPGQTSSGAEDAFIRKYTFDGTVLWTRQFGTAADEGAYAVSADSTGVYVTGPTNGNLAAAPSGTDSFLRKYDANGNVLWTRQISSDGTFLDFPWGVATHSTGVYICGQTQGVFAGQGKIGGSDDSWIRRYDTNGTLVWTRQFGVFAGDSCNGLAVAYNWIYAPIAAGGDSQLWRFNPDGTTSGILSLNSADNEFFAAVATDATGAYVTGQKDGSSLGQSPAGNQDVLLLKVDHPPLPPTISSVQNAFGDVPLISPNTWVSIKGATLSTNTRIWDGPDFIGNLMPTTMDNISVKVNGKPAYIYFISPTQINILTPPDPLPAQTEIEVTNNGVKTNVFTVAAAARSLSFFENVSTENKRYVYARHQSDNGVIGPPGLFPGFPNLSSPAKPGEQIYLAANGFGDTNMAIVSGAVTQGGVLPTFPVIKVGGKDCTVIFAGLVGVGLFQINLTLPSDLPDGDLPVTATYNGLNIQPDLFIAIKR
jgi:uncharacterized protein (TIGR03437 family)